MMIKIWIGALLFFCSLSIQAQDYAGYLFAYFVGNGPGQEQVHYAISTDGYNYRALNNNKPVIDSKDISTSGGVRDPHILRGEDGMFYMVLTDLYVPEMGWRNTAMVLLKSSDLINWTHSIIDIPQTYQETLADVCRVWAPQTAYDKTAGKYMIYWSMLQPGGRDIIYYAYANEDFTGLEAEPKQLLYKDGACIDGDIVFRDGKYHLFFKNEDNGAKGIMLAISDKINEGYEVQEGFVDQTDQAVEGSGTFKLIDSDKYILIYDVYTNGRYEFCETTDLKNFTVIDQEVSMDFHPRHGSVLPITQVEIERLLAQYGELDDIILGANAPGVKKNNVVVDNESRTVYIPVNPGTDLNDFDLQLELIQGATVNNPGSKKFTSSPLAYSLTIGGKKTDFTVTLQVNGNPVLDGYYADPEILFSRRDGKYYLYPTSDGYHNWSGTHFETFSSNDLVNWQPEGTILDLKKDVSWADRNAWAPTIEEKEINNEYKYFYYFTAAQKIGVAVADEPTGPFVDSGKPLIDFKPDGVRGGQEIDPDVFTDPKTGKSYLYWGNGYLAAAELNEDMISIDKSTILVMTPDQTFREGCEVFYRDGKYYFMWSEDDTRSPNYRVRYATADSPLGPLEIPENNLVIEKDAENGIYGTGHNSVIRAQNTDHWFIVYHRFTRPEGIKMGRSAGFHREICIDKLEFSTDGSITKAKPTLNGAGITKQVFELKDPNFEKSPKTGMAKEHWKDAARYLLEGAFSYVNRLEDPMRFPKLPGKSYPHNVKRVPTEKLEGLCRTLFVAAPLLMDDPDLELNGVKVAEYYRHQINLLTNPESPSFIPHRQGGASQILVEFGALAISLSVAPHVLWEPLTQEQKDKLAAVMLSYGDGPTVDSNWKFFNIFALNFFKDQGYEVNDELLVKYLEKSLTHYRGEGWYNDAPAYDYYSMWAFQMYGMVWSELYGKKYFPEIAEQFISNFKDLNGNYPHLFSEDGEMIMYGRSVSYRMGSIVPFPLMGFLKDADDMDINYGWMRRISSGVMLQFLQHPDFMEDGVPSLGFYGHYEPATQIYSCRGSVYWMGKAFLGLLVPDDNPFWTATENNGAWENFDEEKVYNKFQPASEILITDYPGIGASEIRAWCHEKVAGDWQKFRSTENYNRLAYNSQFPWQADGENGEVAMNYAFFNSKDAWEVFRLFTFKRFEKGIYYRDAVLETNENIKMQLADIPLANGILRVDRQQSSERVDMKLGHYALPDLGDGVKSYTRQLKGKQAAIMDNGQYQLALINVKGWDGYEQAETYGLHPQAAMSAVINATGVYNPAEDDDLFVTLMLWKQSGEAFTDKELNCVKKISQSNDGVDVRMSDGVRFRVSFD